MQADNYRFVAKVASKKPLVFSNCNKVNCHQPFVHFLLSKGFFAIRYEDPPSSSLFPEDHFVCSSRKSVFTDEVYPKFKEISVFDPKKGRLAEFFFYSPNLLLSSEIQSIIKLVLVFSHGQASVKRGFNINKSVNKVSIS